ncbi:hypothetical protein K8R04_02295 [Candidatus Uhrbacteria bacterium]|nr:hypothetical protein [Candidatus Uhrbacteria bacterium]
MATPSRHLQTGWIKVWISLGLVITLIGFVASAGMKNHARGEVQRYQECAAGRRDDCRKSLVWVLYEQALKQEGGSGLLMESIKAESSLYK